MSELGTPQTRGDVSHVILTEYYPYTCSLRHFSAATTEGVDFDAIETHDELNQLATSIIVASHMPWNAHPRHLVQRPSVGLHEVCYIC